MGNPAENLHAVAQREHRLRVLKGAAILNGVSRSAVSCTIRNQTESGFGLKIPADAPIPQNFLLWVPIDGKAWRCRLKWRRGEQAGVVHEGWEEKPRWMY